MLNASLNFSIFDFVSNHLCFIISGEFFFCLSIALHEKQKSKCYMAEFGKIEFVLRFPGDP